MGNIPKIPWSKKQKKQKTEEAEPSTNFGGDDVDVLAAMGLPTRFGGKSK
jgi:hypothetical protein